MSNRLENKTAVITGGNSGIGLATAQAFINEGAKVAIFGRDQATLDVALESLGENAIAVRGDVTSDADLDNLYARTKERFGKIDSIFVNAGIAEFIPLQATTDEHFDKLGRAQDRPARTRLSQRWFLYHFHLIWSEPTRFGWRAGLFRYQSGSPLLRADIL